MCWVCVCFIFFSIHLSWLDLWQNSAKASILVKKIEETIQSWMDILYSWNDQFGFITEDQPFVLFWPDEINAIEELACYDHSHYDQN